MEFRPDGAGTLMILTQQAFASAEDRGRHEHGWVSTVNDLARYVESRPPPPKTSGVRAVRICV